MLVWRFINLLTADKVVLAVPLIFLSPLEDGGGGGSLQLSFKRFMASKIGNWKCGKRMREKESVGVKGSVEGSLSGREKAR